MRKSNCETFIAVMSGKNLIKKEQKINQLFIFKKKVQSVEFELFKRIVVKDIPIFNKACMHVLLVVLQAWLVSVQCHAGSVGLAVLQQHLSSSLLLQLQHAAVLPAHLLW